MCLRKEKGILTTNSVMIFSVVTLQEIQEYMVGVGHILAIYTQALFLCFTPHPRFILLRLHLESEFFLNRHLHVNVNFLIVSAMEDTVALDEFELKEANLN